MTTVTNTPYRMIHPLDGAVPITVMAAEGTTTADSVAYVMVQASRDMPEVVFNRMVENLVEILQHQASDQGLTVNAETITVEWWDDWLNPITVVWDGDQWEVQESK